LVRWVPYNDDDTVVQIQHTTWYKYSFLWMKFYY